VDVLPHEPHDAPTGPRAAAHDPFGFRGIYVFREQTDQRVLALARGDEFVARRRPVVRSHRDVAMRAQQVEARIGDDAADENARLRHQPIALAFGRPV